MLAAILAILGVAFAGTIGIGAISSLIRNRGGSGDSSSSGSSEPEEEEDRKPKKNKKKDKKRGLEEE